MFYKTMKITEIRGINPSTVQCWTCRNAPIIDREATLGTVSQEVRTRLEACGENHVRRHPSHRVDITYYTQELPVEETSVELPIIRDIQDLLNSVRPKRPDEAKRH